MNTDRRSFLKSILIAAIAPAVLVPTFKDGHRWKRTQSNAGIWVLNPAYEKAPYEMTFLFNPEAVDVNSYIQRPRGKDDPMKSDWAWPPRFSEDGKQISPFILEGAL